MRGAATARVVIVVSFASPSPNLSPEAGERRMIAKCESDSAAFRSKEEDDRLALITRASWAIFAFAGS